MKIASKALKVLVKKPFAVIYISVLVLAAAVLNRLNPLIPLIAGLNKASEADVFQNVISVLQFIIKPDILKYVILIIAGAVILSALLASALTPGLMNVLNHAVSGKKAGRRVFFEGYSKYFKKILVLSLKVFSLIWLFLIYIAVALVPLMIVLRAPVFNRVNDLIISVVIAIISVLILYFSLIFFRSYLIFWLPALFNGYGKPFIKGKRTVDNYFWKLALAFLIFDIVLLAAAAAFSYFPDNIYLFAAKWLFASIYISYFTSYVFTAFKAYGDSE